MLWQDVRLLQNAGISSRVYGSAAKEGSPVTTIPLRTNLPLITSWEYCGAFLRREKNGMVMACNEPTVAGIVPDRAIVRFEWATPLPRYWSLPGWLPRFQRAQYLFLSRSDQEEFLRLHPLISPNATRVIPFYVDQQVFRPEPRGKQGPLRVGFAGQWIPGKGCGTLLEAWKTVRGSCPEAELCFAGSDKLWKAILPTPGSAEIAETIRKAANEGWLKIMGEFRRAEMPRFWNALDIAVVPSFVEAFGLVALEALACGIPVVATNVGGLKEIVVDGESGLLVPPKDPTALARAVLALLQDEPLRLRLTEGARRRAERFSAERRTSELLELLDGHMERGADAFGSGV